MRSRPACPGKIGTVHLLKPSQIQITSVSDLLCRIGEEYIYNTWGSYVEPVDMDLRWSDCTGDTLILRNHQSISKLLAEHRPHWARAQETGTQRHLMVFRNSSQPYIMRLCHKALPQRPAMTKRTLTENARRQFSSGVNLPRRTHSWHCNQNCLSISLQPPGTSLSWIIARALFCCNA